MGFFNSSEKPYFYDTVIKADHFLCNLGLLVGQPTMQPLNEYSSQ